MRIENPEKFTLEQIYRPYRNLIGFGDKALTSIPESRSKTIQRLKEDSEWSRCVKDRIKDIKFKLPKWIFHPVTNYLASEGLIKVIEK